MAEFTANLPQVIAVNQSVPFTDDDNHCGLIIHRANSANVKLYPKQNQCYTKFFVAFSANVTLPVGETQTLLEFAITLDGEPIATTTMNATPGDADRYFNIASFTYIYVKKPCCSTIGIKNIGTIPTSIKNANLLVKVV